MLKIENLSVSLIESNKEIIKNFSLTINPGEIHLLNGNNGSGKSTLVNALMGNPAYLITDGKIKFVNEDYSDDILNRIENEYITNNVIDVTELEAEHRSILGLFLANQYPVEIPGVSLMQFLRLVYNYRRVNEEQISLFKFKKLIEEKANLINYPLHLLKRNLNEGFSGGEKKKTEILQMLILEPRYVMLDEIDSGLDKNSVKEVFNAIAQYKSLNPSSSIILITHYDRFSEYLTPDFVHEMSNGYLVKSP